MVEIASGSPLVFVCANAAWNLVNFRADLIRALVAEGFGVMAVAPADPAMEAKLLALGCEFAPLSVDAKGLSPLRDLRTGVELAGLLRRHRPAVFLGWTIKPNIYGSLAARLCGVPAIPNVSGLGTAFIRQNLLTRLVKMLYRAAFSGAATVFFQNESDRALFLENGLVDPQRARLVPGSGIDPAYWCPPKGGRPGPRRFLMIARILGDKGAREYVAAARQVRNIWPDAVFSLLGPVDAANRTAIPLDEVERWIAEGVIRHIAPMDDVRPAIAEADFVVLPSYREGLSRVLLEAAAMGRPIVTTDVPGCKDVVSEGVNGYLCEARSSTSLADALARACACRDDEWQKLSRNGVARITNEFSIARVIEFYRQAIADAGVSCAVGRA